MVGRAVDATGIQVASEEEAQNLPPITVASQRICECSGGAGVACSTTSCAGYGAPLVFVEVTATTTFTPLTASFPGIPGSTPLTRVAKVRVGVYVVPKAVFVLLLRSCAQAPWAHRRGPVAIYGAGGIADTIWTDTISDTVPPETALTMAVPAVCSAKSVVVATPSDVRPSSGSTLPRVVWKVTTVSRATGTWLRSVTTAISIVWPPSGMTGSDAVTTTIEPAGAKTEPLSQA